jgi:hypothetical protein
MEVRNQSTARSGEIRVIEQQSWPKKCRIALKPTSTMRTLFLGNMTPLLVHHVTRTKLYDR